MTILEKVLWAKSDYYKHSSYSATHVMLGSKSYIDLLSDPSQDDMILHEVCGLKVIDVPELVEVDPQAIICFRVKA